MSDEDWFPGFRSLTRKRSRVAVSCPRDVGDQTPRTRMDRLSSSSRVRESALSPSILSGEHFKDVPIGIMDINASVASLGIGGLPVVFFGIVSEQDAFLTQSIDNVEESVGINAKSNVVTRRSSARVIQN